MYDNNYILKNKALPTYTNTVVNEISVGGDKVLFIIVGDLNLKGKYEDTSLIFTKNYLVHCNEKLQTTEKFFFADMKEVESKRMYGNATLSAIMPDGKRKVFFRYTYTVAALCDAAALFINHINENMDFSEEYAIMQMTFERALNVCPKCGRNLLHPGAECIKCRSKFKVMKQFAGYITPQTKTIIISILLSLITTAMSLIPPTITGFIVDVVFNGKPTSNVAILDKFAEMIGPDVGRLLFSMMACLLFTYILQFGMGIVRAYLMRVIGNKAVLALRNDIYRKAQHLPMRFYDKTSTGAVINRIANDCGNLQQFMLRITQEAVVHFFQLIGIIIIMLSLNTTLTL